MMGGVTGGKDSNVAMNEGNLESGHCEALALGLGLGIPYVCMICTRRF